MKCEHEWKYTEDPIYGTPKRTCKKCGRTEKLVGSIDITQLSGEKNRRWRLCSGG